MNFYNEFDHKTALWLRELVKRGLIPDGIVDERSIVDLKPDELKEFTQVHLFAGIGGWSYALGLAGWPSTRRVWTGSCPCQPYSASGKGLGDADPRNLWPAMFRIIRECRPDTVFGEQVSSSAVVGANRADGKDVQAVLDKEAFGRILQEQGGTLPESMLRLRQWEEECSKEEALSSATDFGTGKDPGCGRKVSGEHHGSIFRSGRGGYPETNRCGGLRTDGDLVRPKNAQGMEYAISGSDPARSGLHEGQRQSSAVCSKRDGSHMGPEQGHRDCRGDQTPEGGPLERFIRETGRQAQIKAVDWLAGIRNDLDSAGYSFGSCTLAASSVGAPHIRQRLYWMANAQCPERRPVLQEYECDRDDAGRDEATGGVRACRQDGGLGDADESGSQGRRKHAREHADQRTPWAASELIHCFDGKARRAKPGIFPLAARAPARVVRLRGYGNGLCVQTAAAFIDAYLGVAE